jgi:enediyne biosynthesis protein E4
MRLTYSLSTLCVLFLLVPSCKNSSNNVSEKNEIAPADAIFQLVPSAKSGVHFANNIKEDYVNNIITNSYMYNGGGVAIIDVNNDELPDLYFSSSMESNKLYLNKGNFQFEDITDAAGVALATGFKTGVTIVDVDNDGFQDIYVARTGLLPNDNRRNVLFINQKNNTFKNAAAAWGLDDMSASNHANFFDADGDGDLDAYILNHPINFSLVNQADVQEIGGKFIRELKPSNEFESDKLLKNTGEKYEDVSFKSGIWNKAFGLSATVSDLNGDGFPDIYVANDYIIPDFVYINDGKGNFKDRNFDLFRHTSQHTMGVDIADFNNDGLVDLVALDMLAPQNERQKSLMTTMLLERYNTLKKYGYGDQLMRNMLQINNGNGSFSDISNLAGVAETDWSWSCLMQDFDNDGWKDLSITNGYRRDVSNLDYLSFTVDSMNRLHHGITPKQFPDINDFMKTIPNQKLQNYIFKNKGLAKLGFENMSTNWGLVEKSFSNGSAYADLDRDGDLDLVVNNIADEAFIYQNKSADKKLGAWLQLKLEGAPKNTQAVGAIARVCTSDGQIFYEELTPTRGFFSSSEMLIHFGLGNAKIVDLEVKFPDGKIISQSQMPVNQRLTLKWSDAKTGIWKPTMVVQNQFFAEKTGSFGLNFQHIEDEFLDFNRERLLPHKMSAPGPSLAIGDANGDKLEDIFIGGAAGQAGAIFFQNKNSTFSRTNCAAFEADKAAEDTGSAFFDADNDGDLDLVVASGGNASAAGSTVYESRIYQNDGRGGFSRNAVALPKTTESSTAVSLHDADGDGDLDIFLAGAVVPGAWPTSPKSFVFKNEKGQFSDATAQFSPDFQKIGMIKCLDWADLDGDKIEELVAVGDATQIQIFQKNGTQFTNATKKFGLEKTGGFWRSVTTGDFDGDGDLDIVAGNFGLNSRLQVADNQPITIYSKDFDGNGSIDPLMACFQNGKCFPIPLRDVLLKQIPGLKKKFVRYTPYANAILTDVFNEKMLETAQKIEVNILASVFLENKNGKFEVRNLPDAAQMSPIFSFLKKDLDSDGDLDLVGVGNDYGPQVETGRMDAGSGIVLLNDGKANFSAILGIKSGLFATKQARDIKSVKLANGKNLVLVANSDGILQTFEGK